MFVAIIPSCPITFVFVPIISSFSLLSPHLTFFSLVTLSSPLPPLSYYIMSRSPHVPLTVLVHQRSRSYASASRWQVVLWWLCALLIPWAAPLPFQWAVARRYKAVRWWARAALVVFVVFAQVRMYKEQAVGVVRAMEGEGEGVT